MSSAFTNQHRTSVTNARESFDHAEHLDAFVLAVIDGDLDVTMGRNDESDASVPLEELAGILLLLLAQTHDVHPAVLGHGATAFAIENWKNTEAFDDWAASN